MEVETQVLIAERLGFMNPDASHEVLNNCAEVGKILNGLIRSLQ